MLRRCNIFKNSTIQISDLRLWAHLGYSSEERKHPQPIRIDIQLSLATPPKACKTDQLEDTICYHQMVKKIEAATQKKVHHLIEHLAARIHETIYDNLDDQYKKTSKIEVTITKLSPPMANVLGGVSFYYTGQNQ